MDMSLGAFQFLFSVTRFGEISPIRRDFRSLWQTFECLICVWQNFEPTLALKKFLWDIFHCRKIAKFRAPGHTVSVFQKMDLSLYSSLQTKDLDKF